MYTRLDIFFTQLIYGFDLVWFWNLLQDECDNISNATWHLHGIWRNGVTQAVAVSNSWLQSISSTISIGMQLLLVSAPCSVVTKAIFAILFIHPRLTHTDHVIQRLLCHRRLCGSVHFRFTFRFVLPHLLAARSFQSVLLRSGTPRWPSPSLPNMSHVLVTSTQTFFPVRCCRMLS